MHINRKRENQIDVSSIYNYYELDYAMRNTHTDVIRDFQMFIFRMDSKTAWNHVSQKQSEC